MVGTTGFEPATFCSQSRRDTKLRYVPKYFGAPDKIRTRDPHIRSVILYPTELLAHVEVPTGFEPMLIELQSIALPAWLRNHNQSKMYYN